MIFDAQSLFSDRQAITATANSTNTIDFGVAMTPQHAKGPVKRDVGAGRPIPLRIQIVEAFNNLTALRVDLEVANNAAFTGSRVVVTTTVLLADATTGAVLIPQYALRGVNDRYARLRYTVAGTAPTTGKITAGLVFGADTWGA